MDGTEFSEIPVTTTYRELKVERAIAAIELAAAEIPADDFISYSTILDVHLSFALETFWREDQAKLLKALQKILQQNDDLARNIAWDLISVLLPFLDEPSPSSTVEPVSEDPFVSDDRIDSASACLFLAAHKGNPREVFLKLLQALTTLSFTPQTGADSSPLEEDKDADPECLSVPTKTPAEARANAFRKLQILIMLLTIIHSRINFVYPSKFLSQSLPALLGTFTRAVESLNKKGVESVVGWILTFLDSVQPAATKPERPGSAGDGKPTLPPRTATADENEEAKQQRLEKEERAKNEEKMQMRLLQSFLTHVIEVYILRCPTEGLSGVPDVGEDIMSLPPGCGINLQLAPRFLQSNKFVAGGVIAAEISKATAIPTSNVWHDMLKMANQLNLSTTELQDFCCTPASAELELEDQEPNTPGLGASPKSVEDIPLSKIGSLILLASRIFEKKLITTKRIRIFPEHRNICHKYLTRGGGSGDAGVLDAVLFLGAWALSSDGGGFGDAPDHEEDGEEGWLMYLQTYGLLSATSSSPLLRLLAHNHLSQTIRSHPDEATRLGCIKDTLEHCPFESLKASMIGILKDEIAAATTTSSGSAKAPKSNIFSTHLVLEELSMFLFPDLSGILGAPDSALDTPEAEAAKVEWFCENYPIVMATVNLLLFLLLRDVGGKKGVCGVLSWGERIEERWAGKLRAFLDRVDKDKELQVMFAEKRFTTNVDVARALLGRVGEVRKGLED